MSGFGIAVAMVLYFEKGYTADPSDPGGPTRWGVTKNVAESSGYNGYMDEFPLNEAVAVYRDKYWFHIQGDTMAAMYLPAAIYLFDASVLHGQGKAIGLFQKSMNNALIHHTAADPLLTDGFFGRETLDRFGIAVSSKHIDKVLELFKAYRIHEVIRLSLENPKLLRYSMGWIDRIDAAYNIANANRYIFYGE